VIWSFVTGAAAIAFVCAVVESERKQRRVLYVAGLLLAGILFMGTMK
jgi:hypothetical protein